MMKTFYLAISIVMFSPGTVICQTPPPIPAKIAKERGCKFVNRIYPYPHWVTAGDDQYQVAEGVVRHSFVNYEDYPFDHESHDWNVYVELDDKYNGLNSTANKQGDEYIMEMEWEARSFPTEFRPMVGDRIWALGRWVFDCGHSPYKTEIHPAIATAVTRKAPALFQGDVVPSLTTKTYVFINGDGGEHKTTVTDRDYEFDIKLPEKPSPDATVRAEVLSLPYGGPEPVLTLMPDSVHVRYPLSTVVNVPADQRFGAIILAGWHEQTLSRTYHELRITLDSIRINKKHTGPGARGDWQMWIQVENEWLELLRTKKAPGLPPPTSENGLVNNGQTIPLNRSVTVIVPEDGSVTLRTTGWEADRIDNHFGIKKPDLADWTAVDQNDWLGFIDVSFSGAGNKPFGIGIPHDVKSKPMGNKISRIRTDGDFNLRFHIEEVKRYPKGQMSSLPLVQRADRTHRAPLERESWDLLLGL